MVVGFGLKKFVGVDSIKIDQNSISSSVFSIYFPKDAKKPVFSFSL
jgi:hypothetical protein